MKWNSATLRALFAPCDSAVCPTSTTIRNFEGSHVGAAGFKAEGLKATGPSAASLTLRGFGEAAGFAGGARFATVACFGGVACLGDLPGFDELLKTSESQPASLASMGKSTNAAIAAMMVRRRGQAPKPARTNFLADDGNSCFPGVVPFEPRDSMAAHDAIQVIMNHLLPRIYCALDSDSKSSQ